MNREVFDKPEEYYTLDKLRKAAAVDRRLTLREILPLPPLATQQAIVAEIEAEQALVNANRELISRFEKKIQITLARVWGEEAPAAPGGLSHEA